MGKTTNQAAQAAATKAAQASTDQATTEQATTEQAVTEQTVTDKAAAEGVQPTHISVATRVGVERFYRCGREFKRDAVEINLDDLSTEQLERLLAEEHLVTAFIIKE